LAIPRGWGVSKAKFFEEKYKAKPEFPEGLGGGQSEKPSMGKVRKFSGTTHWFLGHNKPQAQSPAMSVSMHPQFSHCLLVGKECCSFCCSVLFSS